MLKTDEYHALEQYQVGFGFFLNISVLMVITSAVAFEQ